MTEKNSMISKKSNRSLQLFTSKDKLRARKKESFQKFNGLHKFPIEFIPKKIYESAISMDRRENNLSKTNDQNPHLMKLPLHKRHLSNNLEDLRPLKRPMSLSEVKKSLISNIRKNDLNYSIQFNQNISQPSFIIGGGNESPHLESSMKRDSISKKKVKKLSILEGSPKKHKFPQRRMLSNKNLCSNDKNQTNSLRNLLMRKRLKKGFSNSINSSFQFKDGKKGRVELTFQKPKKYFTNLRLDKLNTSNSKIFRENPYNSYYQRE
jgi:hypothetical protein